MFDVDSELYCTGCMSEQFKSVEPDSQQQLAISSAPVVWVSRYLASNSRLALQTNVRLMNTSMAAPFLS
jgi:hypothetical protein